MRYIDAKSIIGKMNNVNLYRGCTHGCIYCDARSDCYKVGDFEDIAVKKDAIAIFEKEIKKKQHKQIITTGSMCDPYLPIEDDLQLTRQMLEVIFENGFGVSLLTKSTLILRDIDLIEKIHRNYGATVWMTITTYADSLCRKIERDVSVTSDRFRCLEEFSRRGIPIGIWLTPILPFINDDIENIENIVLKCAQIGVKYIILFQFGTTKRAGSEDYFYKSLDKYFPGIKKKYQDMYGNCYECISPNAILLWRKFKDLCQKHHILYNISEINQSINLYKEKGENL